MLCLNEVSELFRFRLLFFIFVISCLSLLSECLKLVIGVGLVGVGVVLVMVGNVNVVGVLN